LLSVAIGKASDEWRRGWLIFERRQPRLGLWLAFHILGDILKQGDVPVFKRDFEIFCLDLKATEYRNQEIHEYLFFCPSM
jgi:hypothetical protein